MVFSFLLSAVVEVEQRGWKVLPSAGGLDAAAGCSVAVALKLAAPAQGHIAQHPLTLNHAHSGSGLTMCPPNGWIQK